MKYLINTVKAMEFKYRQRKFLFAVFFSWVIVIALFFGKLDGSEFNMALGLILGLYGAQAYFGSKEDELDGRREEGDGERSPERVDPDSMVD